MIRALMIAAASVAVLAFSPAAFAQQPGADADQAKAMLIKAIAAVKADKTKALDMFNKGEGGFLDRDIFPFCFNMSDGKLIATQTKQVLGSDVRTFKDATGRVFGPEVFGAAKENQISEVSYMFPRPGPDTKPVQKVSFVSAVGDLGCGVGYYK
jgi:Cache domain